ncbi:MAG: AMP-binding protein [Proteobacteria bacterium]|nr:AMP-binding protein [Pseudomonadota bacterium]
MEKVWMKHWPQDLPQDISFHQGEIPLHAYLRFQANKIPDKPAIIFYGRKITYGELDLASDRFAAYLLSKGIKRGDRVGVFLLNCPQYAIAHFGIQKIGAIVCPCSPLFKELELAYELNDAGIEILLALDLFMPVVQKVLEKTPLRQVVTTNLNDYLPEAPTLPLIEYMKVPKTNIPGTQDFMEIVTKGEVSLPPVAIDMKNDIGLLQYTGGTTGLPKGCMLSFHAALFKTASTAGIAAMTEDSVCLVTMPIFHIAGMLAGMNSCIYAGATQVLLTLFDVKTAAQAIADYRADFWYSAVPMNVGMMKDPACKAYDLSSLKLCLTSSFGIQLTEEISQKWGQFTKGGLLVEGAYGLSETHTADTFVPRHHIKYDTCGIPGPNAEFKILDLSGSGKEMPIGEAGEIVLKNPGVFKGYWNKPDETARTLIDGWVHTGDIGRFDPDGYLYLLGRVKEMIKVSGFSVYPEEVELLLNTHPEVVQSAVIGVTDDTKGEVVKAYVIRAKGSDLDEPGLIAWAKAHMSSYKCPKYVEFREVLPTLATGKLLRRKLKEEHNA